MASVTAPTESAPSQSQSEIVKAMAVTDATILVAGSMLGSGIVIVSTDIARWMRRALDIALAGGAMLILLSPTSRTQALFGLALVVIGVPVSYLWRSVEGSRPPPPPLPSH